MRQTLRNLLKSWLGHGGVATYLVTYKIRLDWTGLDSTGLQRKLAFLEHCTCRPTYDAVNDIESGTRLKKM